MNHRTKLLVQRKKKAPMVLDVGNEPRDSGSVAEIMQRDFAFCHAEDDYESTLQLMRERGLSMLPVVDQNLRIVGAIVDPKGPSPATRQEP